MAVTLIGRPLFVVAKFTAKRAALPLYRSYVPLKLLVRKRTSASKSAFYPIMSRSALHAIIGILTFAVITQSVMAHGRTQQDFGQKTILGALASSGNGEGEDIVETAEGTTLHLSRQYVGRGGVLATSLGSVLGETTDEEEDDATLAATGGALQSLSSLAGEERQSIVSYTVLGGDTISTIAADFGVSTSTILWANALSETSLIRPGDTLQIPPVSGVVHTVKSGDTLSSIATKYKAKTEPILDFNQLPTADAIQVGDVLIVPGGSIDRPAPAPAAPSNQNFINRILQGPIPPSAKAPASSRFFWPTPNHRINQYYTWRHAGLDIEGTYSSPIYAAADGRVTQVIYQRFGYGYHVAVDHGGGRQTIYAHASKIFVKPGDHVKRGQTIAMVGSTGRSTGTHLHFEVFINGRKVNPLSYL